MYVPVVPNFQPPSHKLTNFIISTIPDMLLDGLQSLAAIPILLVYFRQQLPGSMVVLTLRQKVLSSQLFTRSPQPFSQLSKVVTCQTVSLKSTWNGLARVSLSCTTTTYDHFFPISHTCPKVPARWPVPP